VDTFVCQRRCSFDRVLIPEEIATEVSGTFFTEENIERGLRWVIENRDRLAIRIVSISLGGDEDVSYRTAME
jgi:hypothetical protein